MTTPHSYIKIFQGIPELKNDLNWPKKTFSPRYLKSKKNFHQNKNWTQMHLHVRKKSFFQNYLRDITIISGAQFRCHQLWISGWGTLGRWFCQHLEMQIQVTGTSEEFFKHCESRNFEYAERRDISKYFEIQRFVNQSFFFGELQTNVHQKTMIREQRK